MSSLPADREGLRVCLSSLAGPGKREQMDLSESQDKKHNQRLEKPAGLTGGKLISRGKDWPQEQVGGLPKLLPESGSAPLRTLPVSQGSKPRDFGQCLKIFLIVTTGEKGCFRHLVYRGRECCKTPYNIQDRPHLGQKSTQPQMSGVPRLRRLVLTAYLPISVRLGFSVTSPSAPF